MKKIKNIVTLLLLLPFALGYSIVLSFVSFCGTFYGTMDEFFKEFE
jgi:hypothetical protein